MVFIIGDRHTWQLALTCRSPRFLKLSRSVFVYSRDNPTNNLTFHSIYFSEGLVCHWCTQSPRSWQVLIQISPSMAMEIETSHVTSHNSRLGHLGNLFPLRGSCFYNVLDIAPIDALVCVRFCLIKLFPSVVLRLLVAICGEYCISCNGFLSLLAKFE